MLLTYIPPLKFFFLNSEQLGKLTGSIPMPSDLDVGIATRLNVTSFRDADWYKLKAGLICGRCLCSSFTLTLGEKKGRLLCRSCCLKKFRRYVTPKNVSSKIINFQFVIDNNPCFLKKYLLVQFSSERSNTTMYHRTNKLTLL